MIPVLFVGPLVQLLALGYAANLDVHRHPDAARRPGPHARRAATSWSASPARATSSCVGGEDTADAVEPWLVDGRAQVALVIAAGYGEDVAAGRAPRVQVIADGTDSNSAVVGLGYASRIVARGWAPRSQRARASLRRARGARPRRGAASSSCPASGTTPTSRAAGSTCPRCWPWS